MLSELERSKRVFMQESTNCARHISIEPNRTFDWVRLTQLFCESSIVFDYRTQSNRSRDWVRFGSISFVVFFFHAFVSLENRCVIRVGEIQTGVHAGVYKLCETHGLGVNSDLHQGLYLVLQRTKFLISS